MELSGPIKLRQICQDSSMHFFYRSDAFFYSLNQQCQLSTHNVKVLVLILRRLIVRTFILFDNRSKKTVLYQAVRRYIWPLHCQRDTVKSDEK